MNEHGALLLNVELHMKVLAGLTEALNLASQACTALADSSRLAGSWLAHADLQSTASGDLQQVSWNIMHDFKL